MSKVGMIAVGAVLVGAGWLGAMASGCSTAHADGFAEVAPPEVIEVACKADAVHGAFAEQSFPGRKAVDLARATAVLHYEPSDPKHTDEYMSDTTTLSARDGSILVRCIQRPNVPTGPTSATLIVPPAL
jgi:hypothetical protein